jgi:hypothetical protein
MIEEYSNFITIIKLDSTSYRKQAIFITSWNQGNTLDWNLIEIRRNRVLKLFRYVCKLLMSIVEDRRHVDVPSHSVKFDSIGLCTHSLRGLCTHLYRHTPSALNVRSKWELNKRYQKEGDFSAGKISIPSCWTKAVCFSTDKRFVRPSAIISADLTYSIRNRLAQTSWRI